MLGRRRTSIKPTLCVLCLPGYLMKWPMGQLLNGLVQCTVVLPSKHDVGPKSSQHWTNVLGLLCGQSLSSVPSPSLNTMPQRWANIWRLLFPISISSAEDACNSGQKLGCTKSAKYFVDRFVGMSKESIYGFLGMSEEPPFKRQRHNNKVIRIFWLASD